jgi:hypothetical protein
MTKRSLFAVFAATLIGTAAGLIQADDTPSTDSAASTEMAAPTDNAAPAETAATDNDAASAEKPAAEETMAPAPAAPSQPAPEPMSKPKKVVGRVERADSFVAPKDWEFDGFVAGGKDQEVKSMFYLNDLVYLNVGTDSGFTTGDKVRFYKRGQKVRDPQTGRTLGYEVRMTASGRVSDRTAGNTCAVRILMANEAVEIGDLVRRDE